MRHSFWAVPVAVAMTLAAPLAAMADDATDYLRNVTVINLDGEAHRVVTQDRVSINLMTQTDGKKSASEAQAAVNAKMQAALAMAKKVPGVKVSTGYYNSYKQYPPEPKPLTQAEREKAATWTAQQTLVIDSGDKDAALKLAGALQQQDFAMQGMNFYLSREAQDKLKDELLAEALASVKARAQKVATIMDLPKIHFATINLNGGAPVYPVMMKSRMMAMAADSAEAMPQPAGQEGESTVDLRVNVEVHLSK